jgi:hypothetical protein
MHDYHLIAQAAAIRLIDLAGDEGIRMLQSGITDAVEGGQTESLALALRDAEIHKFELARGWPRLNSEKRLWVAHPCGSVFCKGGAFDFSFLYPLFLA